MNGSSGPAAPGLWRRLAGPALLLVFVTGLAAVVVGAALVVVRTPAAPGRPEPLSVGDNEAEIAWLYPANNLASWERFVAATQQTGERLRSVYPDLEVQVDDAFPPQTATTSSPEARFRRPSLGLGQRRARNRATGEPRTATPSRRPGTRPGLVARLAAAVAAGADADERDLDARLAQGHLVGRALGQVGPRGRVGKKGWGGGVVRWWGRVHHLATPPPQFVIRQRREETSPGRPVGWTSTTSSPGSAPKASARACGTGWPSGRSSR